MLYEWRHTSPVLESKSYAFGFAKSKVTYNLCDVLPQPTKPIWMSVGDSEIGFPVTNSRNIKSLARLRMTKTGEGYTTALRNVKELYRDGFTFGESPDEYWDFFHPHLLLSDETQFNAFFEARKAEKTKAVNLGHHAYERIYTNEGGSDNRVTSRFANTISFARSAHEMKLSQDTRTIAVISDLSSLSQETLDELSDLLDNLLPFGVTVIAMSSQPLPENSPLLSAFRVIGSGYGEYDAISLGTTAMLAHYHYGMENAMKWFTDEDKAKGFNFNKPLDQDRFLRIARQRYMAEHGGMPNW